LGQLIHILNRNVLGCEPSRGGKREGEPGDKKCAGDVLNELTGRAENTGTGEKKRKRISTVWENPGKSSVQEDEGQGEGEAAEKAYLGLRLIFKEESTFRLERVHRQRGSGNNKGLREPGNVGV